MLFVGARRNTGRFICWAAFHLSLSAARISLSSGRWMVPPAVVAKLEALRLLAFLTSLAILFMSETLMLISAWIELPA